MTMSQNNFQTRASYTSWRLLGNPVVEGMSYFVGGLHYKGSIGQSSTGLADLIPAAFPTTFQHCGAVGDGVTDDYASVNAALQSEFPIKNDPRSVFRCSTPVLLSNKNLHIEDTNFLFAANVDGIAISQTLPTKKITVKRTKILTESVDAGVGLAITHSSALCTNHRNLSLVELDSLVIGGSTDTSHGWLKALYLENVNRPVMGNHHIYGRRLAGGAFSPATTAVEVIGTSSPVDFDFSKFHIRTVGTGIYSGQTLEGFCAVGATIVNVGWGIVCDWDQGASVVNPGFFVSNCHINARHRCIKINNIYEYFITNNEFYRFPNVAGPEVWRAFELIACDRGVITGNTISGDPGSNRSSGSHAGLLNSCKRSLIADNRGYGLNDRVVISGAAPGAGNELFFRDNVWEGLMGSGTMPNQTTPTLATNCKYGWSFT
jgi:hypothetical protein